MNSRHAKRLVKAKSQEILDTVAGSNFERSISPPHSSNTGIVSKMKKVLGSYTSSPMEKRRAQSLSTLNQGPTFGVPIEDLLQKAPKTSHKTSLQHSHPPSSADCALTVPHIVTKIIEHVEGNGLRQEGIYRVNGNARIMENLKISFNRVGDADLTNKDIFSVGGVLKLFLRELPVSLIPEKEIDEIVELQEVSKGLSGLSELRDIVKCLPEPHYDLLKFLCRHLLNVSKFSDENKMTPVSLSIVFGPSVLKCGGGLDGLKRQGNANAAFAKMMQNYSTVFEDDSLLMDKLSVQSSDGSFGSRFKKIRKKPNRPEPYQKHKEQKTELLNKGASPDPNCSRDLAEALGKKTEEDDMDDAIDKAFEAVIREDIEASAKKQRKSEGWLATQITIAKPKGLFQSNDLTARVSSPYSWKSSTGTSPTSSPVVSPRTSEVFTTLIGDAIQDHLFETQTVTTSFSNTSSKKQDTISTFSSVSSLQQTPRQILHENIKQSNSDDHNVTDPQGTTTSLSILRRNVGRGSRNRRSAVYSETTVEESQGNMKKFISTGDLQVHLLTVNDDGIKDWRKTQQDIDGVDTVTGTVDTKQPNNEEKINKKEEKPRDETVVASEENGIHEKICESNSNKPPEEFDCVARSTGILYHPTLQRVRVHFKRAKPSRRSMILKKDHETKFKMQNGTEKTEQVKESPPEKSVSKNDSEFKSKQERSVSVSSFASVSSISRPTSHSSPPEVTPDTSPTHTNHPKLPLMHMETIVDNEEEKEINEKTSENKLTGIEPETGIAPEDKPAISKAWSKADVTNIVQPGVKINDINLGIDITQSSYEELLRLAQKLRSTVRDFKSEFFKTYGRKPSMMEQSKVNEHVNLLTAVKKKLKDIRANGYQCSDPLPKLNNKHVKKEKDVLCDDLLIHSATKLDQEFLSLEKRSKLVRHQSLLVCPDRTSEISIDSPLASVSRKMVIALAERREKAERPEDLNIMTQEQLMDEKQVIQKMLLNFERKYRRPQTREEKDIMRPVYDRYREIKKQVANYGSRGKILSTASSEAGLVNTAETTLESVTLLHSPLTCTTTTTTMAKPVSSSHIHTSSLFPDGPSSFVLPLSPQRHSNQKHTTFKKQSSLSAMNGAVSLISSSTNNSLIGSVTTSTRLVDQNHSNDTKCSSDLNGASVSELNLQLTLALAKKKELRKELRDFEHEFEERNKRPLTKSDKKLKFQQYIDYRSIKSRILEISDILATRSPLYATT